ncbi:hypothetical protein NG726_15210 [Pseudomonas sp. MOB-449]|nr:hypothetical protein [Pseudomonas sp. MOB-449]
MKGTSKFEVGQCDEVGETPEFEQNALWFRGVLERMAGAGTLLDHLVVNQELWLESDGDDGSPLDALYRICRGAEEAGELDDFIHLR